MLNGSSMSQNVHESVHSDSRVIRSKYFLGNVYFIENKMQIRPKTLKVSSLLTVVLLHLLMTFFVVEINTSKKSREDYKTKIDFLQIFQSVP
jgi:hypothetical protein